MRPVLRPAWGSNRVIPADIVCGLGRTGTLLAAVTEFPRISAILPGVKNG